MADRKIPSLNAIDTPVDDDLLLIVDDATSSPVNKKVSLSSLFKNYVRSVDTVDKSQTRKELNVRRDVRIRNETTVDQPVTVSVSGLNDISSGGTFSGTVATTFEVQIDGSGTPDTFKWRKDGGTYTSTVNITGSAQTLSDGVTITFAATTGHTVGDRWIFAAHTTGRIEFGSFLLQEDDTDNQDFSEDGFINLQSGIDVKLEDANDLHITANTTTIKIVGDQLFGTSSNKIGFFGTAPVSQNTSSSSMSSVSDIKDELVRLGLIS